MKKNSLCLHWKAVMYTLTRTFCMYDWDCLKNMQINMIYKTECIHYWQFTSDHCLHTMCMQSTNIRYLFKMYYVRLEKYAVIHSEISWRSIELFDTNYNVQKHLRARKMYIRWSDLVHEVSCSINHHMNYKLSIL